MAFNAISTTTTQCLLKTNMENEFYVHILPNRFCCQVQFLIDSHVCHTKYPPYTQEKIEGTYIIHKVHNERYAKYDC